MNQTLSLVEMEKDRLLTMLEETPLSPQEAINLVSPMCVIDFVVTPCKGV